MICGEVLPVMVGEKEYSYQEFFDGNGEYEKVKFYDTDGVYITEFPDVRKMMDYLSHKDPVIIQHEIETLRKFRERCKSFDYSWMSVKGSISEKEKKENNAAFMERLQMLMGDMNSYQFGAVVGLNSGTIYNISHGTRGVGMHILKRIAEVCGVSVEWLMGG